MNNQDFNNNQGFAPQNQPEQNQGFAPNQGYAPNQGFAPNQGSAPNQGFNQDQAPADPFAPQFAAPVDPKITEGEKKAGTSKKLGIIGLIVGLLCCGPAGIVLDILAIVNAVNSKDLLGCEHPDAKTGKICGIVGIALSVASTIVSIASGVIASLAEFM